MSRSTTRRWCAALTCAVLLAVSGCAPRSPEAGHGAAGDADRDVVAGTDPALSRYYEQDTTWGDCEFPRQDGDAGADLQCTQVTVPVDYGNPGAGDTFVAVSRLPASGSRQMGALFMNPGGPGASGVDMMLSADFLTSPAVRENYDLVGFDPRGVDRSDGIECLTDRELDRWREEPAPSPGAASLDEMREVYHRMGEQCHEKSSAVVSHMDTRSVARDLDVLRAVLDQPVTHYLGFSYGTEIGAAYAHSFPRRTGRMVLDGGVDPTLTDREATLAQAEGFEANLRHWVAQCQETDRQCPVGTQDVDRGVQQIRDLLSGLEDERITVPDGRRITAVNALEGILVPLYSPRSYPQLDAALTAAFEGDYQPLMAFSDSNHGRDPSGAYTSNVSTAFIAVNCLDSVEREVSDADMDRAARELARAAPTFGPYLGYGAAACQGWPDEPVAPLDSYRADSEQPVVVVGTTHDPATPHEWSESLAAQLGHARLVSYEGWGHTAYSTGDRCVRAAVDDYLVKGTVPADGTRCP